eukprot:TRINITY_DN60880_c0_g1_i1.p1 TRINITY_DN60880_c0_g1~~TRINITY_DN60880_c0_g1_i1.p1  ORF type:complete len:822 (+),score=150.21 TRINITY_DN60880_c0_g1_i1:77-2542(+)
MEQDEKLVVFLETLGEDADVDFARQMLVAHGWDLEAAVETVTGGGGVAPSANAGTADIGRQVGAPEHIDEDGYRAPMRTGFTDQLIGGEPGAIFENFAASANPAGSNRQREGYQRSRARSSRGDADEQLRFAVQESACEYQRLSDQREQAALAEALQASYAVREAENNQRMQYGAEANRREQEELARAVEASYREQSGVDTDYRNAMSTALAVSENSGRGGSSLAGINRADGSSGSGVAASVSRSTTSHSNQAATRVVEARPTSGHSRRPRSGTGPVSNDSGGEIRVRSIQSGPSGAGTRPVSVGGRQTQHGGHNGLTERASPGVAGAPRGYTTTSTAARSGTSPASRVVRGGSPQAIDGPRSSSSRGTATTESRSGVLPQHRTMVSSTAKPVRRDLQAHHLPPPGHTAAEDRASAASGQRELARPTLRATPGRVSPKQALPPQTLSSSQANPGTLTQPRPASPPTPSGVHGASSRRSNHGTPPSIRAAPESHDLGRPNASVGRPEDDIRSMRPLGLGAMSTGRSSLNTTSFGGCAAVAPGQLEAAREAAEAERRRKRAEEAAREADRQRLQAEEVAKEARAAELSERRKKLDAEEAERAEVARRKREEQEAERARRQADSERQRREAAEQAETERRKKLEVEEAERAEAARRIQEDKEAEAVRVRAESEWRRREAAEAEALRREAAEAERRRAEEDRSIQKPEERDIDEVVPALVSLRKKYKDQDLEGLTTCLQTLRVYISNLAKNPHDAKFQRIRCDNNAFRNRVAAFEGAADVLRACGFEDEDGALVVNPAFLKSKGPRLFDALTKVDVMLNQIKHNS